MNSNPWAKTRRDQSPAMTGLWYTFFLTPPNHLSKNHSDKTTSPLCQQGPHLVPDSVSLQELHSRTDQLHFVSLRGIVQRRVAQRGLRNKDSLNCCYSKLGEAEASIVQSQEEVEEFMADREPRSPSKKDAGPEHGSHNRNLLTGFISFGSRPIKHQRRGLTDRSRAYPISSCALLTPVILSSSFSSPPVTQIPPKTVTQPVSNCPHNHKVPPSAQPKSQPLLPNSIGIRRKPLSRTWMFWF